LKQGGGTTSNKITVTVYRFSKQTQDPTMLTLTRQDLPCFPEITGEIEHHAGLSLGFDKIKIAQRFLHTFPMLRPNQVVW
jgi:hypothetical protein